MALLAGTASTLWALGAAGPAAATDIQANCTNLDAQLATAEGGDTVILDSSLGAGGVVGAKLCSNGQHNLPTNPPGPPPGTFNPTITLKGNPSDGNADGFDGTGVTGRVLTGVDVHTMEITDLLFRDSTSAGNGGAISITGDSHVAIRTSKFFNNHADSGKGGAVYISAGASPDNGFTVFNEDVFGSATDPAEGNSAMTGGAASVDSTNHNANSGSGGTLYANNIATKGNGGGLDWVQQIPEANENVSFTGDTYVLNKAAGSGGGLHVKTDQDSIFRIDVSTFDRNSVEQMTGGPTGDHSGGGAFLETNAALIQRNNKFTDNAVRDFTSGNLHGGGEAIKGDNFNIQSQNETYTGNNLALPADVNESEGAGLAILGTAVTYHAWLSVVAGNAITGNVTVLQTGAPGGNGGGAFIGAGSDLEYADSTIAGNEVGANGAEAGLAGGGTSTLKLTNSIVHNPNTDPDIGGFNAFNIQYSDACQPNHTPFPGTGNLCVDPILRNPSQGDIHETPTSPTIDKGNDQLFLQEEEGPCCDFEGDPRPVDGDGDGHTADMGADESPAVPRNTTGPVAAAATPQCADGKDNDGDGAIDLKDPGCSSAADNNEGDESLQDLVLCGSRQISLVRADAKGKRVVLNGLVAAKFAGKPVTINANYGKKKLATVKAKSSGAFSVTVKGPSRKFFNKARFSAKVDKFKSVALKLPQSLASSSVKLQGATIVLSGKVKRSLLGKRNAVVVRRIVCGRYTTVGQAKPNKNGTYVVRFSAPGLSTTALYRAETKVLAKPRGKRYVKQFARALGIALTGQTG